MNKIAIIIKREYLRRVRKRSFILLTFLTPVLFTALLFVPLWLSTIQGDEIRNVAVIDRTGKYVNLFEDAERFHFIPTDQSLETYRNNPDREIFAFIYIEDDLLQNPKAGTIYSEKQVPAELTRLVNRTLRSQLEKEKLASFNIPNLKEIIEESRIDYNIQTRKWTQDGGETASSSQIASTIGLVFTLLVYMFITLYGAMVMQGVMEEKTNRIVEVIISSVKPFQLMLGKIVGVLFVGLTQFFIWGVLTLLLFIIGQGILGGGSAIPMDNSSLMAAGTELATSLPQEDAAIFEMLKTINIPQLIFYFILYFIGGYLLYGSLFAAIGSAVDQQEDSQQFMTPIMILLIFALYAGIYSSQNPDGPLAFWGSLFPLTSPVVMMIRLPFDVPLWEKILSLTLLLVTALGITWVSAKIYRVGILIYGKKPGLKEMFKWIRYK